MNALNLLFLAKDGGAISAADTVKIDNELAQTDASEIPFEQIQNVIDYINIELFHNEVASSIRQRLERLLAELQSVQSKSA